MSIAHLEDLHLYQKISAAVRQDILSGELRPGDRLPSIRQMVKAWECTPGTVQRAYQELARQGLVVSQAGKGTHVLSAPALADDTPLRRANLINRTEAFLLEVLTAGYTADEIDNAWQIAWEHWRSVASQPEPGQKGVLRFVGSHDPALTWLAAHWSDIVPSTRLQIEFCGSLGGLIALAQGKADLAGCHLWDEETGSYNAPFVQRVLPGKRVALLTLAQRRLGFIVPKGNPAVVSTLNDLTRPELRFVNRQVGSGTRVWLDAALHQEGIPGQKINGYSDERITHSDVARTVANGEADVGFGLETAALSFGLDFIDLVHERYDLAIPENGFAVLQPLVVWLQSEEGGECIAKFGGYDTQSSGTIQWIS